MNYKVIEKTEYGVRVRNYSGIPDCNICKYHIEKRYCTISECAPNSYYLPDSEVEKLESELTPETFTINDMYVESKLLFDCQDQLKDLQIENNQLKERIKELKATIENMKAIAGYESANESDKTKNICEHVYVSNLDPDEEDYDLICKKCGHRTN